MKPFPYWWNREKFWVISTHNNKGRKIQYAGGGEALHIFEISGVLQGAHINDPKNDDISNDIYFRYFRVCRDFQNIIPLSGLSEYGIFPLYSGYISWIMTQLIGDNLITLVADNSGILGIFLFNRVSSDSTI